ncbi:MAG TPA: zinc-dependent metalloprotease [Mycobacteriales bacterium]|nr:zinc-dependent metalloprotease [Mycobacteriales bacterium]
MTRPPMGFGPSGGSGDEPGEPVDPFAALNAAPDLGAMLHQLGDLMSGETGPVNWQVARQSAMAVIGADAGTTAAEAAEVADAVRLADLWLDPVTSLPSGVTSTEAWSRRRWLEATRASWSELVEPVAAQVSAAMGQAIPEEMRAMAAPLIGVMTQVGGLVFGSQVGQALGTLATEVVAATDIGLPLGPAGVAALLPESVRAFGDGLAVPGDQVRLFIALREAAHQRLFAHVPWLRGHLFSAVRAYAEGISIDSSRIEDLVGMVDPSDPEALQQALGQGLFEPTNSPAQQSALERLETALALVEGWVDVTTAAAASASLPSFGALQETMRRRRATGGPAERTFATLVGLELRPRRARDAAVLWQTLAARRGVEGRDAIWDHPDLLPAASDLDDPQGWADRGPDDGLDISELDPPTG